MIWLEAKELMVKGHEVRRPAKDIFLHAWEDGGIMFMKWVNGKAESTPIPFQQTTMDSQCTKWEDLGMRPVVQ